MRKDMHKVVTTRPRHGGHTASDTRFDRVNRTRERRYFKGVEVDNSPKQESMRKRYHVGGDPKYFSDHIQPLLRYLEAQVGRPWNDVWSEICQSGVLKGSGLQAQHIKDHVKQAVGGIPHSGETSFEDREWFAPARYSYENGVYVNEKGILCKNPPRPKRPLVTYPYVYESPTVEYHKINGAWFRMELAKHKVTHRGLYGSWHETEYYATDKRALSRKEIKKLDLNNRLAHHPPRLKT